MSGFNDSSCLLLTFSRLIRLSMKSSMAFSSKAASELAEDPDFVGSDGATLNYFARFFETNFIAS